MTGGDDTLIQKYTISDKEFLPSKIHHHEGAVTALALNVKQKGNRKRNISYHQRQNKCKLRLPQYSLHAQ